MRFFAILILDLDQRHGIISTLFLHWLDIGRSEIIWIFINIVTFKSDEYEYSWRLVAHTVDNVTVHYRLDCSYRLMHGKEKRSTYLLIYMVSASNYANSVLLKWSYDDGSIWYCPGCQARRYVDEWSAETCRVMMSSWDVVRHSVDVGWLQRKELKCITSLYSDVGYMLWCHRSHQEAAVSHCIHDYRIAISVRYRSVWNTNIREYCEVPTLFVSSMHVLCGGTACMEQSDNCQEWTDDVYSLSWITHFCTLFSTSIHVDFITQHAVPPLSYRQRSPLPI